MAAVWETRVADYMAYVEDPRTKVFPPQAPVFLQGNNHPVVNVSREDAEDFCRWLTDREYSQDLISKNYEYRLPTDEEWSLMAGQPFEVGDPPQERAVDPLPGYPWGDAWPPPRCLLSQRSSRSRNA